MSRKRLAVWSAGLLGILVLLAVGAALVIISVDLRPAIEDLAGKLLDRRLTIGSLRIGWGDPLTVELKGLQLANAPWGSSPQMVTVESLSAEVDLWSIFSGPLRFRKLAIVKPIVVLERDPAGTGNWKFGGPEPTATSPSPARGRAGFPSLHDLSLQGGLVTFRTSSGGWLRVELSDLRMESDADDRPVSIAADGAYNGIAAKLTASGQPYRILRDASAAYGIDLSIENASTSAQFHGTLLDPLNFDGAQGALQVEAQKFADLVRIFGTETSNNAPVQIAGDLARSGNHWTLANAKGKTAAGAFTGSLALAEGGRGQADDITLDLDLPALDVNQLVAGIAGPGGGRDWKGFSLHLDDKRGTNIAWRLGARQAVYGKLRVVDLLTQGRLESGLLEVTRLKFALAGGAVDASGSLKNLAAGGRLTARAQISNIDVGQLFRWAGDESGQITGRLDGGATVDMTGNSMAAALGANQGHALLAVNQGRIARDLIEKVSTDLRSIFRKQGGVVQATCLLGILDLHNGIAAIWPLRLRTADGTLVGHGQADFLRQRLDLTIQSVAASTSFFALDVPVRISGEFRNLQAGPEIGSSAPWPANRDPVQGMPADMRQTAEKNACLR